MSEFSPIPRPLRMTVAAIGASLATVATLGPIASTPLFLLGMALTVAALAGRNEFRLDLKRRRFQRIVGFWPWWSTQSGAFEELRAVQIDAYRDRLQSEEDPAWSPIVFEVSLSCRRADVSFSVPVLMTDSFSRAAATADEIAKLIPLPLIATPGLERQRPKLDAKIYERYIVRSLD